MTRAIAATTQVSYIAESTNGVTPATPAMQLARVTGESLEVMRKLVYSGELNAARGPRNYAMTAKSGGGGFDFEFSDGSFEDILESALRGAWATDVLVNGNTGKSFTLETRFETGGTDIFKRLRAAEVNTLSLTAKAQEIVTGKVEFMSRFADFSNAAIAGVTYTAPNSEPMETGDRVGTITMAGLTLDAVTSVTFTLNNNMRARPGLGSQEAIELAAGDAEVSGTVGLYLSDTEYDVLTAFQDGVATSLSFRIGSTAGKIIQVSIPRIVLEGPKPNAESKDGDLMLNLNFKALQSSTIGNGLIQLTRNI